MKVHVITFNGTVLEAHVVYSAALVRLNALRATDVQSPCNYELTTCLLKGEP